MFNISYVKIPVKIGISERKIETFFTLKVNRLLGKLK